MRKKLLALLLVVTVVVFTATACGGTTSTSDVKSTDEKTETTGEAKTTGEAETLTVWCWDESYNIPIMETAAQYYREAGHENFNIEVVNVEENDVETKSITAFTAGVSEGMPDILLMGDYSAQSFLKNYAGKYADLTDDIDFLFTPNKLADYTVDGRIYGVPFDSGSAGMYYRNDLFEQAGYTAKDLENITWSQLIEIAKDVKEATGKYVFVFTPYKGTHYIQMALQACGQWFYAEDGSADFVNNEVIRYMCGILKEMYDADLIYPVDYWSAEGIGAVQNGDIAAHISGVWYIPTLTGVQDMSGLWGYTKVPTVEGVEGATQYSNIGGSSWVVLEDSKNKDLAIDFLKTVYAGNDKFYQQILTEQGAVGTYLPSANGSAYDQEVKYFGGAKIYKDFAEWGKNIPEVDYGEYTNEAVDALRNILQDYFDNKLTLDEALTQAEQTFNTQTGK